MNSILPGILEKMPPFARRQELVLLFWTTARAFRREMPRLRELSREECLREYALFTLEKAGEALRSGEDLTLLQERLYWNAYRMGRATGWMLGVRNVSDVMVAGRILYEILDIEINGSDSGEIMVSRCYFSSFYTPEVCELMSAMDRGLFAGLAGKGDLEFTQRITEGQSCCRARFRKDGSFHTIKRSSQ